MRALLEVLVALVAVTPVAAYLLLTRRPSGPLTGRRRAQALARCRWEAAHVTAGERTVVLVRRALPTADGGLEVLESRQVAVVGPDEVDYSAALSAAVLEARVRADVLNTLQG